MFEDNHVNISESAWFRKKKQIILILGILLFIFSSGSKMFVPAPIYNQLLNELHFDPVQIASLGAYYMYAYAFSQLVGGIYSDRYGGVRILLIGSSMLAFGLITFPLSSRLWLMQGSRIIAGLGAGMVFLGVAKLIADLYPQRFSILLGIALFCGYLGTTASTFPFVWLVKVAGWRKALCVPGAACLLLALGICLLMRGTIKRTVPGQTLEPLKIMLHNKQMILLCISSAIVFGVYYTFLTQIGQKCLEDIYHLSGTAASIVMAVVTVEVACNNLLVDKLIRLAKGSHRAILIMTASVLLLGLLVGVTVLWFRLPVGLLIAALLVIAFPSGCFAVYSVIARNINPPSQTGLAVAMLNFAAFVFIALFGNVSGIFLNLWKDQAVNGIFPISAYASLMLFMVGAAVVSLILGACLPKDSRTNIGKQI